MRLILNVLWAVVGGGFLTALEYLIGGVLLCLTVVGIPFGLQCFKLAGVALFPFGKDLIQSHQRFVSVPLNIFWFFVAGIWICITHLSLALACAVTIIGIPFAVQHVKLAMLALTPFGVEVRELR